MQTAYDLVNWAIGQGAQVAYGAVDRGLVPDRVLRRAVRFLCQQRLNEIERGSIANNHEAKMAFVELLRSRDIAIEQHYEVSTEFIKSCLGPRMKYSSCLYPPGRTVTLSQAEDLMLDLYTKRAQLEDGMDILDLGCGWGSLCLYLAERYPNSKIYALSNSSTQKLHIDSVAREKGFKNLTVYTGDVKTYEFGEQRRFDRVMSIEMFEHMKNYELLLGKVASWLKPKDKSFGGTGALVFVHVFCHRSQPYDFAEGDGWMTDNFFSGGTMLSFDLFSYFQRDLILEHSWWLNGNHYAQTLEAWLKLQDKHAKRWLGNVDMVDGKGATSAVAKKQFYQFRLFFLACAEFFALGGGEEWGVGHYLFKARS